MSTVLCFSSQVARGYVGGSATRIALERKGHECWLLPTVVLSNHPGHERFAGEQVPVGRLRAMFEALQANGWLEDVDAVLLGYMPSVEHVTFVAGAVEAVRKANADVLCLCDPILGDDPGGLYVDDEVAAAVRDEFLPIADIVTPNRFELEWLGGKSAKVVKTAKTLAGKLGPSTVLVTSLTGKDPQSLVNLLISEKEMSGTTVAKRKTAPHGVGDLMAALYLSHILSGASAADALGLATGGVEEALEESDGRDELCLCGPHSWAQADAWPVEKLDS